jgi:uncharacterized protein YidB (DUF937 family)
MDDLSNLSTGLSGSSGAADPAAVAGLTEAIQRSGGLDGLVDRLRQGGLEPQVDSWVSTGPNDPVDPQRLGQALGPDTVQQLSAGSGLDVGALLPILAMFLPQMIDMLTKNGSTPTGGLDSATGRSGMPDLGGLLGGLIGGALGGGGATGMPGTTGTAATPGTSGTSGTTGSSGLDGLLRGLGNDDKR